MRFGIYLQNQAVKTVDSDGNLVNKQQQQNLADAAEQQTNGRQPTGGGGIVTDINSVSPYEVCFSSVYKVM